MIEAIVTKSGNSYVLRVPKSYVTNNNLKLGDKVSVEDPLDEQKKALNQLLSHAKKHGAIKSIPEPVSWQRQQRQSTDPWQETAHDLARQ
jgi:antitoxin component of MazEF toxin-antitoxin module